MKAVFGYARVSTSDQTVAPQVDALVRAGVEPSQIYRDEGVSGLVLGKERVAFAKLLISLKAGDTLVVVRLDRLGRSVVDVLQQVEALTGRGITVRSLGEGVDSSTPAGRMVLTVMAGLAAYERELMMERQRAGIESARKRGTHMGRPWKLNAAQKEMVRDLLIAGRMISDVAQVLGCSESTVRRCAQRLVEEKEARDLAATQVTASL
jgi:DNA invertase Pin-like site-specific DNA recombinase